MGYKIGQNADKYSKARKEATRSWADQHNENLKLAGQGDYGWLGWASQAPGNLWENVSASLAEGADTNYQPLPSETSRWNVYEAMLKAAQSGQPADPRIRQQWESLLKSGSL